MIFSKDGFADYGTTTATASTDEVVAKNADQWLLTINDSLAKITGSKTGSASITMRGAPTSFIVYDEFAYCNPEVPTTAWSDYGCGITTMAVNRNDLHDALHIEQYGEEGCDPECCDEEGDYIGALIGTQNQRLNAMEAMISGMQPNINTMQARLDTMERELAHERSMRYMAEYQLRTVETQLKETKDMVEYTRYVATDASVIIGALDGRVASAIGRISSLEQLESLTTPSVVSKPSVADREAYVSWKLESGNATIRGASPAPKVSQDEILYSGTSQTSGAAASSTSYFSLDSETGMVTVTLGKVARAISVDASTLHANVTPHTFYAHPGDTWQ